LESEEVKECSGEKARASGGKVWRRREREAV